MKKYEQLDKLLEEIKPFELADYLIMNNIRYAEELSDDIDNLLFVNSKTDKIHPNQSVMEFE